MSYEAACMHVLARDFAKPLNALKQRICYGEYCIRTRKMLNYLERSNAGANPFALYTAKNNSAVARLTGETGKQLCFEQPLKGRL